jgi:hypothetical protein
MILKKLKYFSEYDGHSANDSSRNKKETIIYIYIYIYIYIHVHIYIYIYIYRYIYGEKEREREDFYKSDAFKFILIPLNSSITIIISCWVLYPGSCTCYHLYTQPHLHFKHATKNGGLVWHCLGESLNNISITVVFILLGNSHIVKILIEGRFCWYLSYCAVCIVQKNCWPFFFILEPWGSNLID